MTPHLCRNDLQNSRNETQFLFLFIYCLLFVVCCCLQTLDPLDDGSPESETLHQDSELESHLPRHLWMKYLHIRNEYWNVGLGMWEWKYGSGTDRVHKVSADVELRQLSCMLVYAHSVAPVYRIH